MLLPLMVRTRIEGGVAAVVAGLVPGENTGEPTKVKGGERAFRAPGLAEMGGVCMLLVPLVLPLPLS